MTHGGQWLSLVDEGWDAGQILDLSASLNRYGPGPAVTAAWPDFLRAVTPYPDLEQRDLRRALSGHLNVPVEAIWPVAGATAGIDLLLATRRGQPMFFFPPAFSEYVRGARRVGCPAKAVDTVPKERGLGFLANPASPTGQLLDADLWEAWITWAQETQSDVVVDESFLEFVPDWRDRSRIRQAADGRGVVLGSLTKFYGLAGLRVGYVVGHPRLIQRLRELSVPWAVSTIGALAAMTALDDERYFDETRRWIARDRAALTEALTARDVWPWPGGGQANFLLVRVEQPKMCAKNLRRHGILVRTTEDFLGDNSPWIRLATPTPPELIRLQAAWDEDKIPGIAAQPEP